MTTTDVPGTRGYPASAQGAPRIRVLAPEVAARIAAGEVIERPASVVKELVENALDAGARRIEVAIAGGGIDRIRVRDDGRGIEPPQLADAFERHATSKLRAAEDLFTVRTLGFRGEALAAIVAAADVTCTTRVAGESAAAVARFVDGRALPGGSAAAAPGTTFEVRELFSALPARRRFLRSARAEARAVAQVVSDYALARPEVALRLESEGRTVLASPGAGGERAAWAAVYDDDLAAALIAFEYLVPPAGEGGVVAVRGLVGPPERHRGNRGALHLVVNGRAVSDRALAFAVERAYEGLLPAARHPVGLVRIEVDPAAVDVNVHPAKAEVRFREARAVAAAVTAGVRGALAGASAPAFTAPVWGPPVWAPEASPGAPAEARAVLASARPASPFGAAAATSDGARDEAALPLTEQLPALRPLGQFSEAFLVAEAPDGLYLVDQHAAHERVRYEQVRAQQARGEAASQPLLEAVLAPLGAAQAALAAEEAGTLAALGFVLEPTDGSSLIVRAVPAALAGRDPAAGAARPARPHGGGGAAVGAGARGGEPCLPLGGARGRPAGRGAAARAAALARGVRAPADVPARPPDAAAAQQRAGAAQLRAALRTVRYHAVMTSIPRRCSRWTALLLAIGAVVLTGCIRVEVSFTVQEDGSGAVAVVTALSDEFIDALVEIGGPANDDGSFLGDIRHIPGAIVEEYREDGFSGERLTITVPDMTRIDEFLGGIDEVWQAAEQLEVEREGEGWRFELVVEPPRDDLVGLDDPEALDALDQGLSYTVRLSLPGRLTEHDADRVEAGEAVWELDVTAAEARVLRARSQPASGPAAGLVAGAIVAVVVLAVLAARSRSAVRGRAGA